MTLPPPSGPRRSGLALVLALACALPIQPAAAQAAGGDCGALAEAVEREAGLPTGLLVAIGRVETGRPNPATGRIEPWPWSTNAAGIGHYFANAAEAIAWTAGQLQGGQRSVDVGCFQINLKYHPDAFTTLEEAFDPASNARYAATFLTALYRRTGSWQLAAAQYHSADPQEGGSYGNRVFALMGGGSLPAGPMVATVPTAGVARVTMRLPLAFAGVRVIVPAWAIADSSAAVVGPYDRSANTPKLRPAAYRTNVANTFDRRLPRVYTPS